ncbi:MAG: metalloregulator ArsR/SmtB family transcription factor [Pseudomonadota bacterium]
MNEEMALAAFGALSNRSRLAVVRALVKAGPNGLKAGEIAEALGSSPSQASFHLSTLAESGLIVSQRNAKHIIYRVNFAVFQSVARFLLEDCCRGASGPVCYPVSDC